MVDKIICQIKPYWMPKRNSEFVINYYFCCLKMKMWILDRNDILAGANPNW